MTIAYARTSDELGSVPDGDVVARAAHLSKVYGTRRRPVVVALDDVTVEFGRGRLTAIMGPSGSGKSTLMHCMAALDAPTSGQVVIDGVDIHGLKDKALTMLRRDRLGFVFQSYNLVPTLTARENITLPLDIAGAKLDSRLVRHRGGHAGHPEPPVAPAQTSSPAGSSSGSRAPEHW